MFEGKNHVHAMTTAFGALGGFPPAPAWWTDASKSAVVQLLALTVLVYQGGGALDVSYSLAVAVVFTIICKMTSSMQVNPLPISVTLAAPAAVAAPPVAETPPTAPTEFYHNY